MTASTRASRMASPRGRPPLSGRSTEVRGSAMKRRRRLRVHCTDTPSCFAASTIAAASGRPPSRMSGRNTRSRALATDHNSGEMSLSSARAPRRITGRLRAQPRDAHMDARPTASTSVRPCRPCAQRLHQLSKAVKSITKQANDLGNRFGASLTASYQAKFTKPVKGTLTVNSFSSTIKAFSSAD